MNRLLKLLGYRDRKYHGDGFSVRIEPIFREVLSVIYTRGDTALNLGAEYIGKKWAGISVGIPQEVEDPRVSQIAHDLETAFQAMGYGYVIARSVGVDVIPEDEQAAALAELREMGWEIEVSADRTRISQKRLPGAPRLDVESARKQTPRMMSLIQSLHGKRKRFEILAKSKEL